MDEIVESSEYESPALAWLYREIARLDERMFDTGIHTEEIRHLICVNYFFAIGETLTERTSFQSQLSVIAYTYPSVAGTIVKAPSRIAGAPS